MDNDVYIQYSVPDWYKIKSVEAQFAVFKVVS